MNRPGLDECLVSLVAPYSFAAEQYRILRMLIEQMHKDADLRLIAVASAVATASSALAAPKAWPCAPFVELTNTLLACSPKVVLMARLSFASLSAVPVPWALM